MTSNESRNYAQGLTNVESKNLTKTIFDIVNNSNGISPSEVNEILDCSYSAVRNIMSAFQRKGLATVEKEGRIHYYYPTEKSDRLLLKYNDIRRYNMLIERYQEEIESVKEDIERMVEKSGDMGKKTGEDNGE
ncbi:MAG: winged helix-turn-helix domain-containing protein [Candidatus Nanohaloarchaea archaeon]